MSTASAPPETGLFIEKHIRVATYDIDFANHVSNIAYLRWLEDMRLMLFEKYFPLKIFMDKGQTPVLASTEIHYRRAIKLFDEPYALMWLAQVTNATIVIQCQITVNGQLTTDVSHTGVFIDLTSGKPIRVPANVLTAFKESKERLPQTRSTSQSGSASLSRQ